MPANERPRKDPTEREFLEYIDEFNVKTNKFAENYTMGHIIDMLQIRYEELQIHWACSAQNPALLPEKLRGSGGREKFRQRAEADHGSKSRDNSR